MRQCIICNRVIGKAKGEFCNKHYKEVYLPNKDTPWMKFLLSDTRKTNRKESRILRCEIPLLEEYEYDN